MTNMRKPFTAMMLITMAIILFSFTIPSGWFKAGSAPKSYDMGVDLGAGKNGKNAATIKSNSRKIRGFGTLMQNCLPDKYLGKRVRMSGLLKTKDVSEWAGLWFRIDDHGINKSIGFDNMKDGKVDRSVKGTNDWMSYDIVLDVPQSATNLAYGALLVGTGQIWFDEITFEIVDNSVPTTGKDKPETTMNKEPINLDFEK
jgi:hypothetical protein